MTKKKIYILNNIVKNFNFDENSIILPTNLKNYLLSKNKFPFKTLLPVNKNNFKINNKIYCNDKIKNKIKLKFNHTSDINDCFLVIYENNLELTKIKSINQFNNNKILINYKNLNEKLIQHYLEICKYYIQSNIENINKFFKSMIKDYKIIDIDFNSKNNIEFEPNQIYILRRKNTNIYNINDLIFDFNQKIFFLNKEIYTYEIDNYNDKEFIVLCYFKENKTFNLVELLNNSNHENINLGYNLDIIKNVEDLYYLYGLTKMYHLYKPLNRLNNEYLKIINEGSDEKFNFRKMKRIYSFNRGLMKLNLNIKNFNKKYKHKKLQKVLIVSKNIKGYGGNQKTARQLYYNLEKYYDVYVLSVTPSEDKEWTFKTDSLCYTIHNQDIIKIKKVNDIINFINDNDFLFIINNKFNNYFDIIDKTYKKISVITHNSMDPFNRLILNNSRKIDKVFTINQIHSQLFQKNKLKCKLMRYLNYIDVEQKIKKRNKFKKKIVFVGRLSHEKNVKLLQDAFEMVLKKIKDLELIILGDGKEDCFKEIKNVTYFGRVDYEIVKLVLLNSDYLILPSNVEGLPFTILEAMSLGIPCICSNINGINEVINSNNGFLFNLKDYDKYKNIIDNWKIIEDKDKNYKENKISLYNKILEAYNIDINKWNELSNNCYDLITKKFNRKYVDNYNYSSLYLY